MHSTKPVKSVLEIALRVLTALNDNRTPNPDDVLLVQHAAGEHSGMPLDELTCNLIHREIAQRSLTLANAMAGQSRMPQECGRKILATSLRAGQTVVLGTEGRLLAKAAIADVMQGMVEVVPEGIHTRVFLLRALDDTLHDGCGTLVNAYTWAGAESGGRAHGYGR